MPIISGHVYYDNSNSFTPGTGIANVPVALFNPVALIGAVALTDSAGAFSFTNVSNGSYQLIETWGTGGGSISPVNFATAAVSMLVAPTEAEPPLSALSVVPPTPSDRLQALIPNLLNITVSNVDVPNQNFFDGPVGDLPLTLTGINLVGPNLITIADNGTWGSNPSGTPGNTRPATNPYPGVSPGFGYSTSLYPSDGNFTITNTGNGWANGPWWMTSDHTIGLETGRFQMVNGANPGNAFFSQVVSVTPNTNYALSAWIMNLINFNGAASPQVGVQVLDAGGNIIFSQAVKPIPKQNLPVWFQNGFLFSSGANSTLTVQLISVGPLATGNDYTIDDITMFEAQSLLIENKTFTPATIYSQSGVGEMATVTVTVTNPTVQTINNVEFLDNINPSLTFVPGSVTVDNNPNPVANPNSGFFIGTLAPGQTIVIKFQVTTTGGPVTVPNNALIGFDAITSSTGDVTRGNFPTNTANLDVVVNNAMIELTKTVDKSFANAGDVITYTLTLMNAGNVSANSVVLTDAIPTGTTFVPGSVTGATGIPPTLTLSSSIPAGGTTVVTFQVLVGNTIPNPSLLSNSATAAYTYTVDPSNPNGASGNTESNLVTTQVNSAIVATTKEVDLAFSAPGDIITYTITLMNSGNADANNTVLTDAIPAGTTFVPGSLVGATGTPPTLTLNSIVPANGSTTVTFQVQVDNAIPAPNPLQNSAMAAFTYTVDPAQPNGVNGTNASNTIATQVNAAIMNTVKSVDKTYAEPGDIITYTLTLTNTGNVPANNVIITDAISAGTTYVAGSVTGATGTPPTLTLENPVPAGGAATVTFQVLVGNTIPNPSLLSNNATAAFTFTTDPAQPNGRTGVSDSNTVTTQINSAIVTASKTANLAFADVNSTVNYTITLTNTGNVTANNVILTDFIPAGATFVAGSLVGATGTPPTLILTNPVPAGGIATVSFDVLVGNSVPNPNPLENSTAVAFTYTVDPVQPNGVSGTAMSGSANTQINHAQLVASKSVDKPLSYIGDTITYQISVKNIGNVSADNVILTDLLPTGVSYVAGSLVVSVPYSGTLSSGMMLTSAILAGGIVTLSFKAKVDAMPNPNPIVNKATATYVYTVDPVAPDAVTASTVSNSVSTIVFRYNFGQQIFDLIESVALEQAALAAIAQAEGAKIQKMVAISGVTSKELLCLNKSLADMMDSIAMLEAVLKQKLNLANCQINGTGNCM